MTPTEKIVRSLARDRRLAHMTLFEHRHPNASPPFHFEMIDDWHNTAIVNLAEEGFRGCAKSTTGEEATIIRALFNELKNGLIIGPSEPLAQEHLATIKHELETNETILGIFGDMRGPVWQETKIELKNGVKLQVRGKGQSLRGTKHLQWRPDWCWIDDLEDEDSVRDPEARREAKNWVMKTLLPVLDPGTGLVRMTGNRLHDEAVIVQLARDPDWTHRRYPIMHRDAGGQDLDGLPPGPWAALWPDRFNLGWVAAKRAFYVRQGSLNEFQQEYMCEASDPTEKVFQPDKIRVIPRTRTWEAAYAFVDPARRPTATNATTGGAVWSWVGTKLVVWRALALNCNPTEVVKLLFDIDAEFRPVAIGIEEDGLEEWLMQPIRQEMMKRGHAIPIRAERAPRDRSKAQFIRGLVPFFTAGEVEFATELPSEVKDQLLSFPTGRIDFPNALAFAPRMRPGALVYDDFAPSNVAEELSCRPDLRATLAINATGAYTTAVLVQFTDGLRVLADWAEEGDAGSAVRSILTNAQLIAGNKLKVTAPPARLERFDNSGLRQALQAVPIEIQTGAPPRDGQEEIRGLLRRQTRGMPALRVSHEARWTLNAFSGGYAHDYDRKGELSPEPRAGIYRTLMEGLESYCGLLKLGYGDEDAEQVRYAVSRDGRQYKTALAR